jgi:translation initiation factor IF-3
MQNTNNQQYRIRINNFIRVPQIRVIGPDGNMIGVMQTRDALRMAQEQSLDLVEINPRSAPPVCKIMDYGKYKYEEKKKLSEIKKHQKSQELKEVSLRPVTDEGDLIHKLESVKSFLTDGHKVKISVKFKGREITHPEIAKEKLSWFVENLKDLIAPVQQPSLEGKFMHITVSPAK